MIAKIVAAAAATVSVLASVLPAMAANAAPVPDGDFSDVPSRTSLSFQHTPTGIRIGTANQFESRPGLSIVKIYMADYAVRRGDGSATDRALAERMIRYSDDGAAYALHAKYPNAIDAIAVEFRLTSTRAAPDWDAALTSTADTVTFIETKKVTDPLSPILGWMAAAAPVAADGTHQNWGTSTLPDVIGSKWGWSDDSSAVVASTSFGPDFTVAAQTYGSDADQTADVAGAFGPGPLPQLVGDPNLQALLTQLGEQFGLFEPR